MSGELFRTNDEWQRQMRDKFLVPYYRAKYGTNFMLLDGNSPFVAEQQRSGRDTIISGPDGPRTIEEKIVRWPGAKSYTAIACEVRQCGKEGYVTLGWMYTCNADLLLYCFETEDGGLDCLVIDFPRFRLWFFENETTFPISTVADTLAGVRVVDIERLRPFLLRRFMLKATAETEAA